MLQYNAILYGRFLTKKLKPASLITIMLSHVKVKLSDFRIIWLLISVKDSESDEKKKKNKFHRVLTVGRKENEGS